MLAAVLIYDRRTLVTLAASGVLAVLWAGLVLTLSRSSLGALLVGLGTLALQFESWGSVRAIERLNLDGLLALWHPPAGN